MRVLLGLLFFAGIAAPGAVRPLPDDSALRSDWAYVESCSGAAPIAGHDFAQLVFLVSPYLTDSSGRHHIKARWAPGDTIVIDSASVTVPWVIRHEMLHALLQTGDHPMQPFAFPCKLLEKQQGNP